MTNQRDIGERIAWNDLCVKGLLEKSKHSKRDVRQLIELYIDYCENDCIEHIPQALIGWMADSAKPHLEGRKPFPTTARLSIDWDEVCYILACINPNDDQLEKWLHRILIEELELTQESYDAITGSIPDQLRRYRENDWNGIPAYLNARYKASALELDD